MLEMKDTRRASRAEADEERPHRLRPGRGQVREIRHVRGDRPEGPAIDQAIVDPVDEEEAEVPYVHHFEFPVEGVPEIDDVRGPRGGEAEQGAGDESQRAYPARCERAAHEEESAA